jgi:uncharacterized lipoprotein
MRIAVVLLTAFLATSLLAGCKSGKVACRQSNKDYVGAREMPPLKAPPGLEAPNTRNALKVPQLDTPERVRGRDEACLDMPPPFATPAQNAADPPKPKK